MSSPLPRDRDTEGRFLSWLAERDAELAAQAPSDLETLAGLGALALEGSAFAGTLTAAGLDDETTERLLQLHAAWTRFRRREREEASGIAWVGHEAPAASRNEVTWVGADGATASSGPPTGPAPSLLAPGARPIRPELPKGGAWRLSDLFVPLSLLLSTLLLLVPVAVEGFALRELRSRALASLRDEASRQAGPKRLEIQANHGAWLLALRNGQLEAVNATCEGGPWCSERVLALTTSRRLAGDLVADARAGGAEPQQDWRPDQAFYTRELSRIQARLAQESGGDPGPRRVLQAELGWLRAEASR